MSTQGPDPRASARGLLALALDMARVDPERRPSADMRSWLADFATAVGESQTPVPLTNRELVTSAMRLERIVRTQAAAETDAKALAADAR